MSEELEYCPTRGGKYAAYEAEFFDDDGNWRAIRVTTASGGVPGPRADGAINCAIGLQGFEQAWAIAWLYAADRASEGIDVQVRLAQFEVQYDIKAKRLEMPLSQS